MTLLSECEVDVVRRRRLLPNDKEASLTLLHSMQCSNKDDLAGTNLTCLSLMSLRYRALQETAHSVRRLMDHLVEVVAVDLQVVMLVANDGEA